MINYNIQNEIRNLTDTNKIYKYLYKASGFELGFGKKGIYQGHSHFHFCDLMFSDCIETKDINGVLKKGTFLVVPPKTYMDDVITEDFFFLKFCPKKEILSLPDKTTTKLDEGTIISYNDNASLVFDWFNSELNKSQLKVELNYKTLDIEFVGYQKFSIEIK